MSENDIIRQENSGSNEIDTDEDQDSIENANGSQISSVQIRKQILRITQKGQEYQKNTKSNKCHKPMLKSMAEEMINSISSNRRCEIKRNSDVLLKYVKNDRTVATIRVKRNQIHIEQCNMRQAEIRNQQKQDFCPESSYTLWLAVISIIILMKIINERTP